MMLATLLALVERAARRGERSVTVRCASWLPKHLLSKHRRFRSPDFFSSVLALHRRVADLGVALTLRGGPAES